VSDNVYLTKQEKRVLRLIPVRGTVTARELAEELFGAEVERRVRPEVAIGDVVRRLVRKGDSSPNGLGGFRVHRTRRAGRKPIEIRKSRI